MKGSGADTTQSTCVTEKKMPSFSLDDMQEHVVMKMVLLNSEVRSGHIPFHLHLSLYAHIQYACLYAYVHTYVHTYTHTFTNTYCKSYLYIYIYMYTDLSLDFHKYIYIYMCVCVCVLSGIVPRRISLFTCVPCTRLCQPTAFDKVPACQS